MNISLESVISRIQVLASGSAGSRLDMQVCIINETRCCLGADPSYPIYYCDAVRRRRVNTPCLWPRRAVKWRRQF